MIFMIHYLLLNAGMPGTTILLALYLQTYSETSLSEIGTLLMVLPFLSIVIKPLLCALADRHQAHKHYLAGSILVMFLGYGVLQVPPFFPSFYKEHGRLVWYLYMAGVVVGYSAFGVVFSLGDALAVNAANRRGVPWGAYRAIGTFSWGFFGFIIGMINETPLLPKYMPALLMLSAACILEVFLLLVWPDSAFKFDAGSSVELSERPLEQLDSKPVARDQEDWQQLGSLPGAGSARMNARLINAVAGIMAEDIGNTLKSSLKLGGGRRRTTVMDLVEQHQLKQQQQQAQAAQMVNVDLQPHTPTKLSANGNSSIGSPSTPSNQAQNLSGALEKSLSLNRPSPRSQAAESGAPSAGNTLTRAMILKTQRALSRMNSLSSATGLAIFDNPPVTSSSSQPLDLEHSAHPPSLANIHQHHKPMVMSSLASNASLSRAAAARALGFSAEQAHSVKSLQLDSPLREKLGPDELPAAVVAAGGPERSVADLQMVLLKIIVKRDPNVYKFIVLFTLFGILLFVHINFFFLHVEALCREHGCNFSSVMGVLLVAQSSSEIFTFLVIVPCYMPRVGRIGSMLTCCLVFLARYLYYASYYQYLSPYSAIGTEICHGVAYGITYTLITDIAVDCVNQVDAYLPELVNRGLVDPKVNPNLLKLPLRATMQGVFSGAFDGLGAGLGSLIGGVYLDYYSYTSLWWLCTAGCALIMLIYPITEWRTILRRPKRAL